MPDSAPLLTVQNLTEAIFEARRRFEPRTDVDPNHYVKLWREEESVLGRPGRSLVLILRTRGCTWDYQHSCTMCGYFVDVLPRKLTPENFASQWDHALREHRGEEALKIYTGGNFLDPAEVPPATFERILGDAAARFRKITVETRPEYVTPERMKHAAQLVDRHGAKFEVAIGLESSSDVVCHEAINKGYGFREFVQAADAARAHGVGVKTYLLLKPPFLTESETVEDAVSSIRDAAPYSDVISVNPTNVQKFTLVEQMWKAGEYRPPWLWSVVEVLRRGKPLVPRGVLKSDPVGGGTRRGAHNCGTCDERLLHLVDRYNVTQDAAFLEAAEAVECRCRPRYRAVRRLEGYLLGGQYVD